MTTIPSTQPILLWKPWKDFPTPSQNHKAPRWLTGQSSQVDDSEIAVSSTAMTENDSDDTPFETTESFLKDLENAEAEQNTTVAESNNAVVELAQSASIETTDDNVVSTGSTTKTTANTRTRNIIIITSVTLAAALAAGIIIYRKKIEREEESK